MSDREVLLEVQHLSKRFAVKHHLLRHTIGQVYAVNKVSFTLCKGDTLGLVGESGCGKSTLGRMILRLIKPTEGHIVFDGIDVLQCNADEMRSLRRKMQVIFQDPYASLNPSMSIQSILEEPLKIYHLANSSAERIQRIYQLLDYVQLPKNILSKYPHEFSGGQRQRICIARALAVEPIFIVCDEAIAALDVSVQAQVINLLMDLQKELGLTYLFISHDLRMVEFMADYVVVMYLGKVVEAAPTLEIYNHPKHPYTKALFSAIPTVDPAQKQKRIILQGEVPNPTHLPTGCHFHPRCWKATALCAQTYPAETFIAQSDHRFTCYHPENS